MAHKLSVTVTHEHRWGPGTILAGKYRVERVIGTGGMGVVVAAIHEQLEERVAVKLLRAERLAQQEACERVLREARATVRIQSDHVVRVFDVATLEDKTPYIVMEYLSGCDLAQLLTAEGKLAIADAASYVRQACDAIGKAHALGIVHRDLKPANLFLAVRDEVASIKVLDFGISKVVTADGFDPALTGAAAVLGSPTYMSPEQIDTPRDVDRRTDVWSLGVILYELATGAHPFVGDTFTQLATQIRDQPVASVRALRSDAPEALDAIITRCLAKRREDRFQDVGALAEALAPIARETDHRMIPAFARTAMAGDRVDTRPTRSELGAKHEPVLAVAVEPARPRWKLAAIGGVGLVAAGTIVALGVARRDASAPAAAAAPGKPSPLFAAGSILACPQLAARVDGTHEGWLGAAAATIACSRAQARMGGHSARTLIPAELLDLPRVPVDGFPVEPYEPAAARTTQIAAARKRAGAWLDGEVIRDRDHFHVVAILRASDDDRELGRGVADDPALVFAIRAAMEPFEHTAIPSVAPGDRFLSDWFGARTADAAVELTDLFYIRFKGDDVAPECPRATQRTDYTETGKKVVAVICAPPRAVQPTPMPPRDVSSPAALRMSLEADPYEDMRPLEPDLERLEAALARTRDHEERAMLLEEQALLVTAHHQVDRGTQLALAAVREDPKVLDVFASAWTTLSWLRSDTSLVPAANAWVPWSNEAYCMTSTQTTDLEVSIRAARREHVLSPRSHIWTMNLVEWLVSGGKRDEAKVVASELADPGSHILLAASEAKLAKAYQLAHDVIPKYGDGDALWAFNAAAYLTPVTLMLDRPLPELDRVVTRYLFDHPPDPSDELSHYGALVACVVAPRATAQRCLARLRALTDGVIGNIPGLLDGADRYVAGDFAGATLAWQSMLARPSWQLANMRDVMATSFERAGKDDLVERIDAVVLHGPGRYNGAELAFVRAARRAERRGQVTEATVWAQRVIDAWSVADTDVPAVAEMRKLVARLR